jgi:uncharacterized repeat protein (TIGR03803 family)
MKSTTREGKGMTNRTEHQGSTYQVGRRSGGRALAAAIALLGAILASRAAQAQTYTVLYTFTGGADGGYPQGAGVIADTAGNLYGTAGAGGDLSCQPHPPRTGPGCGVVFKLDPAGNETVLHTFTGEPDGAAPFSGLIRDAEGNLYGTTPDGGDGPEGYGIVFELDPSGNERVLHTFNYFDGANPSAGLVSDRQGNLYGTTFNGGDGGYGTVFMLDRLGNHRVLLCFRHLKDGVNPSQALIRDKAGNLYGTADYGGDLNCSFSLSTPDFGFDPGCGVIFKLGPTGKETPLYAFSGEPDGANPRAPLIQDAAGNFYGTTFGGGLYDNGTVFKLDPTGHETVLYNFTGGADGANPWASLVRDAAGNLYGTANHAGGSCYCGTVFKLDPKGNYTVLHAFTTGADGQYPGAPLLLYKGTLYGTTSGGGTLSDGSSGTGTIFKITLP